MIFFKFLSTIRFTILYCFFALSFPILGWLKASPLYNLTNGLFVNLSSSEILWSIFCGGWYTFSLTFVIALFVDAVEINDLSKRHNIKANLEGSKGTFTAWRTSHLFHFKSNTRLENEINSKHPFSVYDKWFGLPFDWHNCLLCLILTIPLLFVVNITSFNLFWAVIASLAGLAMVLLLVFFCWLISKLICGESLPWSKNNMTSQWSQSLRNVTFELTNRFGFSYVLDQSAMRLVLPQVFALVMICIGFLVFIGIRMLDQHRHLPSLAFLFVIVIFALYFFGFFSFHTPIHFGTSFTVWFFLFLIAIALLPIYLKVTAFGIFILYLIHLFKGFGFQWLLQRTFTIMFLAFFWIAAPLIIYFLPQISLDDYTFDISQAETGNNLIEPGELLRGKKKLVVFGIMGGGITAATWSTQVLDQLFSNIPELKSDDTALLFSSVSGGSVGVANYLFCAYANNENQSCFSEEEIEDVPANLTSKDKSMLKAHLNAQKSSLNDVAYALSYGDVWRFLLPFPLIKSIYQSVSDRGRSLEARWNRNVREGNDILPETPSLHDLVPLMRAGKVPAFIFNTTALETGQRIMITPINFSSESVKEYMPEKEPPQRAQTLSEYLSYNTNNGEGSQKVFDLDLWTAARLSSSFPYVLPASQAYLKGKPLCDILKENNAGAKDDTYVQCGHHFIDGGYHDNYGILSLLDFLNLILDNESLRKQLENIVIVQLRMTNFNKKALVGYPTFVTEIAGPPFGVLNINSGGSRARNEVSLSQFVDAWSKLDNSPKFEVVSIIPDERVPGPLSWHLTKSDLCTLYYPTYLSKEDSRYCKNRDSVQVFDFENVKLRIIEGLKPKDFPFTFSQ